MFDVAHSEQHVSTAYRSYPIERPFINSNWVRPTRTLSKAYPESNRDLIMSSLRKLQDKINNLELNTETRTEKETPPERLQRFDSLENQSMETENRVLQLEKQLANMRSMLNENGNSNEFDTNRRLKNLQRDSMIYDAEQMFTDRDINDLEAKLRREGHQLSALSIKKRKSKKIDRKSRCDVLDNENREKIEQLLNEKPKLRPKRSHSIDAGCKKNSAHYRLNLGDIPFVVGTATTPSHHLGSNIQNVMALLKVHHPKLCHSFSNGQYQTLKNMSISQQREISFNSSKKRSSSSALDNLRNSTTPSSTSVSLTTDTIKNDCLNEQEVKGMIRDLREDHRKLALEYYETTKRIINCVDDDVRSELESKALSLNKKMHHRENQISKLKKYIRKNFGNKQKKSSVNNQLVPQQIDKRKLKSATVKSKNQSNGSLVIPNIGLNANSINNSNISFNPNDTQKHYASLKFFKDIKELQTRIQKDQFMV